MPEVLKHLGPYLAHEPVAVFCQLSERCFQAFRKATGGDVRGEETPLQHLATRMMYISETTSIAIRLDTTWALSLPGMSLLRDRYEQVVRFSWLARQTTNHELVKYIASYYAKANKIFQNLSPQQRTEFLKKGAEAPEWMIETPTKEQRQYLERWESLDLLSMAGKRDELATLGDGKLSKQQLAGLYHSIYRQFSSVSHFDMYAIRMLGLHKAPTEELVLAPDPWWPAVLCLHTALFDVIQCYEGLVGFFGFKDDAKLAVFDQIFSEWTTASDRLIGEPEVLKR